MSHSGHRLPHTSPELFRELAFIAKDQYELNLEEVIDTYIETDELANRYRALFRSKDICEQVIRHFYTDDKTEESIRILTEKMKHRHVPIFILMQQGLLPRLKAKGGDIKNISECYKKLFALLTPIVNHNTGFEHLPLFPTIEKDVRDNPQQQNRLHLIHITQTILQTYGNVAVRANMLTLNQEFTNGQIELPIEGIWTEDEANTVFWYIESIINGYYLYQFTVSYDRKIITYTKYSMRLHNGGDDIIALIIHPQMFRYALERKPIPNRSFSHLVCSYDKDFLTFTPMNDEGMWFQLRKLKRSSEENKVMRMLEDDSYLKINKFPKDDYQFTVSLSAITSDYLYIKSEKGSYYRVPKSLDNSLYLVDFSFSVGIVSYADVQYIV